MCLYSAGVGGGECGESLEEMCVFYYVCTPVCKSIRSLTCLDSTSVLCVCGSSVRLWV